ncbi:Gfo/Idh/MocA family oxidoreductase [Pontiellaceae bacterium B12219]|nr:Gfo/Idh/MocA family oxidoreductase [Pontiellaceae bacterium B12219]
MDRKLRMGMVGGGRDAFIGAVHRIAAGIDGKIELVCGAFSSSPEKSKASGKDLMLPVDRCYGSYQEMMEKEAALPEGERMDFVAIVTPNHMHYPVASAALAAGFHVVCDKPVTFTLAEVQQLEAEIKQSKKLFCLTHNYTGSSMVKEARELVKSGQLGKIRRVVVEYPQGWLAEDLEKTGQKQASWRVDPKQAGISCCMGDIGTHCANLAEYIVGSPIKELCSDLSTFVKGRKLDDDGNVLIRFKNGAKGVLWASQIAVGKENGLNIRVYGEKGGIEWQQEEPNSLVVRWTDKPMEIRRAGTGFVGAAAAAVTRTPAGHPEGYLEAFANIYNNFADTLIGELTGNRIKVADRDYPTIKDGIRGMAFLDAVVKSSSSESKWIKL